MPVHRLALALCLWAFAATALADTYAKPELLASAEGAAAMLGEPGVVFLDVRSPEAFASATIPGARNVDVNDWKSKINQGAGAELWSEEIGELGIGNETTVIVFDEAVTPTAARAWWVLKYWGVDDARILNGGWTAWRRAGLKATPGGRAPDGAHARFNAEAQPNRLATTEEVRGVAARGGQDTCLIDTRTDREVGEGVIPTAKHLEWSDIVNPETGELLGPEELEKTLARVGFDPERPAVSYCRSGGRASVMAFAMELTGGEEVSNYFGSFSEWRRTPDAPVVRLDRGDASSESEPPPAED